MTPLVDTQHVVNYIDTMPTNLLSTELRERFSVKRRLGRGAGGLSYLVSDKLRPGRQLVLKIGTSDQKPSKSEFALLSKLAHPHLSKVYDVGRLDDGTFYFTQEYLEGKTIDDFANTSIETKMQLVGQLVDAVAYLHRQGILHRDLKPEHVIVVETEGNNWVKVIDFGLASNTSEEKGSVTGTIPYIAPECFQGEGQSVRTDLYSLGLILFELFAGRFPFKGRDIHRLLEQKKRPIVFTSEEKRLLPSAVRDLLVQLLSFDPRERLLRSEEILSILIKNGWMKELSDKNPIQISDGLLKNDPIVVDLMEWCKKGVEGDRLKLSVLMGASFDEADAVSAHLQREWQLLGGHIVDFQTDVNRNLAKQIVLDLYAVSHHRKKIWNGYNDLIDWASGKFKNLPSLLFEKGADLSEAIAELLTTFIDQMGPLFLSISKFNGLSEDDRGLVEYLLLRDISSFRMIVTGSLDDAKWLDKSWLSKRRSNLLFELIR